MEPGRPDRPDHGFSRTVYEEIPAGELRRGVTAALDTMRSDAVAIAGWGCPDARACLDWCKKNRAQAILMSETRAAALLGQGKSKV